MPSRRLGIHDHAFLFEHAIHVYQYKLTIVPGIAVRVKCILIRHRLRVEEKSCLRHQKTEQPLISNVFR